MATFISRSPEDTQRLGESWGTTANAGLVIGLTGDLGAGKTEFVKGLAHGLGVKSRVHSPTFALLHEYTDGRLPLFHIDLYRLESPSQIIGAGLEEYFYSPNGVTVIEWVERAGPWPGVTEETAACATRESPPSPLKGERAGVRGEAVRLGKSYRHVKIETISESERRITFADDNPGS